MRKVENKIDILKNRVRTVLNPSELNLYLNGKGIFHNMTDEQYLKERYKYYLGRNLDLSDPRRFNEKIQWLKLNDHKAIYTGFVDKISAKILMERLIGPEYIIPNYAIYDSIAEIDYSRLPKQFVMKCSHDSGSVYIHKRGEIDKKKIATLQKNLKKNFFWGGREWPYKNIKPRLLVEKYMGDDINDYKVFVINGKAKHIQVDYDRFVDHHRNFYDRDWNYEDFTTLYPRNADYKIRRPEKLDLLIDLSERVAKHLETPAFVRVDFYIIENRVYFGEVTLYHGSGFEPFYPDEWDFKLGEEMFISK